MGKNDELGCCGSFAPCLNSWHFYPEWRWNFLAKEHIRAQISSYFQKHVVCTIGSEISKLKKLHISYIFSFIHIPLLHPESARIRWIPCGCYPRPSVSWRLCFYLFFSPVLLPPLSPSYLCPSLMHCLPSAPICVWHFLEQIKLWYEKVRGQRNPEQLRTPSPSACLPCSSWTRCPQPELCTYPSVPISGPFPPTVCSCWDRASALFAVWFSQEISLPVPSRLQRQSEVLSLILQ